jgi:uncharacterized protein DUF2849
MKKAAKGTALQAVTANALASGAVVFRAQGGGWTTRLSAAEVTSAGETAQRLLDAALADEAAHIVVEPYLIDVVEDDGGVVATRLREAIRASGPTIVENRSQTFAAAAE